jgi:xanthine/uracil permease
LTSCCADRPPQFLFASVFASGVKVLSYIKWTRKERFILAASASFGLGNLLVPTWATYLFADVNNPSTALSGFFNSIVIILSTPCEWSRLEPGGLA